MIRSLLPRTLAGQVRLGVGILVAAGVLLSLVAMDGLRRANQVMESARLATQLSAALETTLRGTGELILTGGSKSSRELVESGVKAVETVLPRAVETNDRLATHAQAWSAHHALVNTILQQKSPSSEDEATVLAFGKLVASVSETTQGIRAVADEADGVARAQIRTTFIILIGGACLLVGMSVASGMTIMRALRIRLGADPSEVVKVVRNVVAGDLSTPVHLAHGDERSVLAEMRSMQQGLNRIVLSIRQSAESIALSSSEIAAGNLDLSHRTEQTAANLEATASSVHEMAGSVESTASTARTANDMATAASQAAAKGGAVVTQVVDTMQRIDASSRKISEIIAVIDGIAFQTNILALNAAVEAARAGEQGRGFAVVAGEVRALASRSAEAAREIKTLIQSSVEQVESGRQLVEHAGSSMQDIVDRVDEVTRMINEIAQSANRESAGIDRLSHAVKDLDAMTQQNAALVEQASASASSLAGLADQLSGMVKTFKL